MKNRILIVEDDHAISDAVALNMQFIGYEYAVFDNGKKVADSLVGDHAYDLALLDIMLPGIDGFEVCRRVRAAYPHIGIIMLTARSQEMDKVTGLMTGADDYVTKPFGMMEFVARVKAVLRRCARQNEERELHCKDLRVNVARHEVSYQGELKELTRKEFELLLYLMENRGIVMTRDQILCHIWGYDFDGDTRTVDVHIRRLREKIETNPSEPKYVHTKWGVGYYFQA